MSDSVKYGPHNPHPLSLMRTELVWEGKYDDFRNRLIWGDNKLVMASLLSEFKGAIDLIYIDPPFDVGADFTMDVPLGDEKETIVKDQSILEMVAYRDMWGQGTSSYLATMYERLSLINELLSENGSVFVHCDWRVNTYIRALLDEIFGQSNFRNQIVWKYSGWNKQLNSNFERRHDTIFYFSKGEKPKFFSYFEPYENKEEYLKTRKQKVYVDDDGREYTLDTRDGGQRKTKIYIEDSLSRGKVVDDVWQLDKVNNSSKEGIGYPTQKPEALLERIIKSATEEGDIVADFFCGSGTTLAVAEKMGRKWIGSDLGRFAIHTARKRLIGVQRDLHEANEPYRSFDVYNLGRYERQWWQQESLKGAEEEHRAVVLNFFRAEVLGSAPSPLLHGRKGTALIHVDGIDSIFTREELSEVAKAVKAAGGKQVHCLAWDFEMDIRQSVAAVESELGVSIKLHRIPREIMEKNRTEVPPFFEVALLEAEPVVKKAESGKGKTVDVKLVNFLPSLTEVPGKELEALQERAVESGFDFIDFWAVDFDWHPNKPFNHHWQDYRTRKDRALKTVSDAGFVYESAGKHTICVKVVDVFGCDTSITVEVVV